MENDVFMKKIMIGVTMCLVIATCILSILILTKIGNLQNEVSDISKKVKEIHNEVVYLPEEINEDNFGEGEWEDEEYDEEFYEEVEAEQ